MVSVLVSISEWGFHDLRREVAAVFSSRVKSARLRVRAARMLPKLTPLVPMKAKLGQDCRHMARLACVKLNPDPLANDKGKFPKARSLLLQEIQDGFRRHRPIAMPPGHVNSWQVVFAALCGPVQEPRIRTVICFHGVFFNCSAVRSRTVALHGKACEAKRPVEGVLGRSPRPALG